MADIEERVTVARAPDEVRAVILDPDAATSWQGSLVEYQQLTPGRPEKGTQSRGKTSVFGRELDWTAELVAFDERGWTWQSIESEPAWEITWSLEPVEGGTRVTFEQSSPSLEGLGGTLPRKILGAQAQKDLAALRSRLEEPG